MTNWDIACIFLDTKQLLLLKRKWALASIYEKSAYSIIAMEDSIHSSEDVPFLPEPVREDVNEILYKGNSSLRERLEKEIPKGMQILARLPGIRASDVLRLYNIMNIDSVTSLSKAVNSGRIQSNREFGTRMEEQLRKSLFLYQKSKKELSLFEGYNYGRSIVLLLKANGIERVEIAGSIRRGKDKVNNINLVVLGDGESVKSTIKNHIPYKRIEKETTESISLKDKRNISLKFLIVKEPYFASALIYYTGSKMHNIRIKEIALSKGFKCSKKGYFLIKGKTERDVYSQLGMQYIPPEIREGEEEIDLALHYSLPHLIQDTDIKGDLHVHSNFSDGTNPLKEIKEEGFFHRYEYIAITDHSESLKIANGLSRERLLKQMQIIDRMNKEKDFPILLKGSEIEINRDGSLDYGDSIFSKLDFVLCAMHSGFDDSADKNTLRLVNALSNKFVNVLAHPTGRMIGIRQGYPVNLMKVFEAAAENNVALEVNLFAKRMDLSSGLIRQAKRMGVKYFSVGTDAHNVGHLNMMSYGGKVLRRAWLKKEDVINTLSIKELKEFLWKKKPLNQ